MAKGKYTDSKGEYVIVEPKDTLSGICREFLGSGSKTTYMKIATLNNLSNPDLIIDGQRIYLTKTGSSSTSSSPAKANTPVIQPLGLLSTSDNTLVAIWSWSKIDTTESFKVLWTYDLGDGVEIQGTNTSITVDDDAPELSMRHTFDIPDGARKVWFKVKPIAKIKNEKTGTRHWTISGLTTAVYTNITPLNAPGAPAVDIDDEYKLTASLDDVDITGADSIVFQVVKDNKTTFATSNAVKIQTGYASYSCQVDAGGEYKVRCYAYNTSTKAKSDWSSYSSNASTVPATPDGIEDIRATSETSIYVEWSTVPTADTYDIEYSTKKEYFDNTDQTDTKTGVEANHFEFIGLDSGEQYYFRVRAVNSKGASDWTEISDAVIIGEAPSAPTTWSSTTTAIVGEPVILYWVHNSVDGSSQTYAEIEFTIDGVLQVPTEIIKNSENEDEKDKTSSYKIDTTEFIEGTKIEWRVRTAGIALDTEEGGFGEWSTMRTIDVYAQPTVKLSVVDLNGNEINDLTDAPLTSFPFYVHALAGPKTQVPTGYHIAVTSNQIYETVDNLGNPRTVNKGEVLYSKYFDTFEELMVEFTPGNIDLTNSISYTVTCVVSMNSGLTAEESVNFTVSWTEVSYEPNAEVTIDADTLTATIRPYCSDYKLAHYRVEYSYGAYVKTDEDLGYVYGETIHTDTLTGENVYYGVTAEGEEVYFCKVHELIPVTDVFLSVYRREYDGKFTELGKGLDSAKNVAITDPHPALDYARYRIVATSKDTGSVSYYDLPGYPVGGTAIVIQWNEEWSSFDVTEDAIPEQPSWAGSLLKLPYNVDFSEATSADVSFVEYVGREHPVSYYGTQLGETSSGSVSVPKSDKETIYALRRLSKWMGDVYWREPSGVGYWANVSVNFSQKHCDLVVPVTFSIRRVEGGV